MVWFYLEEAEMANELEDIFQSHYGLILSSFNIRNNLYIFITFNPTMVWFYPLTSMT